MKLGILLLWVWLPGLMAASCAFNASTANPLGEFFDSNTLELAYARNESSFSGLTFARDIGAILGVDASKVQLNAEAQSFDVAEQAYAFRVNFTMLDSRAESGFSAVHRLTGELDNCTAALDGRFDRVLGYDLLHPVFPEPNTVDDDDDSGLSEDHIVLIILLVLVLLILFSCFAFVLFLWFLNQFGWS
jgi:hypothetical protein